MCCRKRRRCSTSGLTQHSRVHPTSCCCLKTTPHQSTHRRNPRAPFHCHWQQERPSSRSLSLHHCRSNPRFRRHHTPSGRGRRRQGVPRKNYESDVQTWICPPFSRKTHAVELVRLIQIGRDSSLRASRPVTQRLGPAPNQPAGPGPKRTEKTWLAVKKPTSRPHESDGPPPRSSAKRTFRRMGAAHPQTKRASHTPIASKFQIVSDSLPAPKQNTNVYS